MELRTKIHISILLLFNLICLLLIHISLGYDLIMTTLVIVNLISLLLVFGEYTNKGDIKNEKQDS